MNWIALAIVGAIGALWWAAGTIGDRRRRAEQALIAAAEKMRALTERDERCPNPQCRGKRCWSWRNLGAPCDTDDTLEPSLATGTGRHEPAAAYRRNRQRWNPLTLPERIALAPTAWAQRAGRPVLLGTFARPVLP